MNRKTKASIPANINPSYIELYTSMLGSFYGAQSAGCLIQYSIINYAFVSFVIALLLTILTAAKIETFFYGINFLLAFAIGYWYLTFLLITAITSRPDVLRDVPFLTARLIYSFTKPYSQDNGLNYESIQNLKKIAEADQNSSDWRANFLNIVVIGLIVYLLGVADFTTNWFLNNINVVVSFFISRGQSIHINSPSFVADTTFYIFFWLLISIAVALLAQKLFLFLFEFSRAQGVNRLVILACVEALILFEKANLVNSENLSLDQKKSLLEKIHFQLVHKDELITAGLTPKYIDKTEKDWFLLSDQHYLELLKEIDDRNKTRLSFKRMLGYLTHGKEYIASFWKKLSNRFAKKKRNAKR